VSFALDACRKKLGFLVTCLLLHIDSFNQKWNVSDFMKIYLVVFELLCGTDGHGKANRCIVAIFRCEGTKSKKL
jgi:hypothetical protein